MSGHSKWSTIKRQKETTDKKRGATFTKISHAITIAVRQSGGDPNPQSNLRLRLAIDKARSANMPKENIQRAIDRATGGRGGETIEEVTYEGYGPAGIGIIVQATTDNKQRTGQEIRNIFDRAGGNLATPGSVSYNFTSLSQILVKTPKDPGTASLAIIDLGACDLEITSDGIAVFTLPQQLSQMQSRLKTAGYEIVEIELVQKPKHLIPIPDPSQSKQIIQLLDTLENHDDVQQVFTNANLNQGKKDSPLPQRWG